MSDKTEAPTPKRLRKAREDGQSPLSTFASQSVAFVCAVAVAPAAVAALASRSAIDLRLALAQAASPSPSVAFDGANLASAVLGLSLPILGAAALSGAMASLVQTGGVIATKKLAPSLEKLDPVAGLRQLLSKQRLFNVARATVFTLALAWVTYAALREHARSFAALAGQPRAAGALGAELALGLAKRAGALGLFLAVLDVIVTRRAWLEKLKMTKEEVKREHKESDGDPELKAARERAHHELLASATIANVARATVVVVNPTHIACALQYDEAAGDEAPVLVASGQGDLARRIVEAAHQLGVPVLRDVPLARALIELPIGDEIPEALYEAVAEILREAWDEPRTE